MLMPSLFFQVSFHIETSSPHWISGVQDMDDDVRRVNDLVELAPDAFGLPLLEGWVSYFVENAIVLLRQSAVLVRVVSVELEVRTNCQIRD